MPHFSIKKENIINQNEIEILNDDNFFHLVKVLRVKTNENVKFIDENQNVYLVKITEISKKSLKGKIVEKYKSKRLLSCDICLVQSILANEAQNLLIANATQTGVKEIYPVISDNCSTSKSSLINKVEKWQKVAIENFKQCERADKVKINEISTLRETLLKFKKENIIIFAEKDCNVSINEAVNSINKQEKILAVIGPEGGFSNDEFSFFKENNFKLVSLGQMIYKAPNAVVAGVSNIVSRLEGF